MLLLSFPGKVGLFKVIRDLKVPFSVPNDSWSSSVELLNVKVERRKAGGLERSRLWKRGRFDKLVLQHALEREETRKKWNLTWMDDTLWVWVICEPFLPLETNESTNYLIMISVTDRPIQHYLLSMELIGLFSSSLFPWQNLKTKYIGRLLKRMKELRLCDKLVEERRLQVDTTHPFHCAFLLLPLIMMTRMVIKMIMAICTSSHCPFCHYDDSDCTWQWWTIVAL